MSERRTGTLGVLDDATAGTTLIGDRKVRRLGFGAMRISGARTPEGVRDRDTARAIVRRVVDRGVNFIDTADIYGYGESEEIIAEALQPYPDDLVVATKAGFRPGKILAGHVTLPPMGNPDHIKRSCDESLRRLEVDVIDLYQAHVPDPTVPYADTIGAFVDLQQQGKIRHIGISNVTLGQLDLARSMCTVVSVQNRYNAGDRSSEEILAACTDHGIAFLPWAPMIVANSKAAATLATVADSHQALAQQVALAWLLRRAPNVVPIPGTSQVAHADQNIDAAWLELAGNEIDLLDEVM